MPVPVPALPGSAACGFVRLACHLLGRSRNAARNTQTGRRVRDRLPQPLPGFRAVWRLFPLALHRSPGDTGAPGTPAPSAIHTPPVASCSVKGMF